MLCQRCGIREPVCRDGQPVLCHLFGEIRGYFCPQCVLEVQQPYERELRDSIATNAPGADIDSVPDQMLKFTLCLPIPTVEKGTVIPSEARNP